MSFGRKILITGATDGIGLLLAQKYADSGADVLATGRQPLAQPEKLFGREGITYIRADQSEPEKAASRIAQAMVTLGWQGCDVAVLNAGVGWTGDPVEERVAEIDAQIDVNLTGSILIAQAIAPFLFTSKGRMSIIGSVAHKGARKFATYAATKAGLQGFVRSLREEWRGRARVQIIHPGAIRTGMHAKAGLKAGALALTFMSANRGCNSILAAIEKGPDEVRITKRYAMRKGWRVPKRLRS